MDAKQRRAVLAAVLAAAAILRMAWVIGAAGAGFDRRIYCGDGSDRNVEAGHSLLHGLPHERVFWSMPAASTAAALMCRPASPAAVLAAPAAGFILGGLLVFGLGRLLAGGPAGALALAIFAWTAVPAQVFSDRWLFRLSLILVAYLAAWRARFPSTRKTVLLAAAIGLSLNALSALFLLPVILAARERRGPDRLRRAALLLLVPFLLLLPWSYANWRTERRVALFEAGRSDTNVITGALGQVRTVGPSYARGMVGLPPGESAAAWAAGEVARHPRRYAFAVASRLRYAASLQPLLLASALLALWLFRRRPAHAALGAVILYYLCIHCLMAVEERYFAPLWPLAAAASAAWLGVRSRGGTGRPAWHGRLLACALVPLAALAACAARLALAYPSRSADPAAWKRELARAPGDAWLLGEAGKRSLREGRPAEAAAALALSLREVPDAEKQWLHSCARLIARGRGGAIPAPAGGGEDPDLRVRALIMRAMFELRERRPRAASEDLARAMAVQSAQSASWGERSAAAARDTLRSRARELAAYWPIEDRLVVLAGLEAASPASPLWTPREEAREALRRASTGAVPREDALRLLDEADRLAGEDESLSRRAAEEFAGLGAPERGADALGRLAKRRPRDFSLRLDLAALARAAGRRDSALRALSEAGALAASEEETLRLAGVYRELGEPRRAAALLARLKTPAGLAELARLRVSLRDYAGSLRLLDELVRREPDSARWRNDRGVTLMLLGRTEEAVVELRAALARDPGLRSAAQTLDAAERGRTK